MSQGKVALSLLESPPERDSDFGGEVLGGLGLPARTPGAATMPSAADMAAWRRIADLQLEKVLSAFDDRLIKGIGPSEAASWAIRAFCSWVETSLTAMPSESAMSQIGARGVQEERERWEELGKQAASGAEKSLDSVDRFLKLYLAMAHEVSARGYASLLSCWSR